MSQRSDGPAGLRGHIVFYALDADNDLVTIIIALTMFGVTMTTGPNLAFSYRHRVARLITRPIEKLRPRGFDRLPAGGASVSKFLPANHLAGFSLRSSRQRSFY
jgi:hypothetical protein